MIMGSPSDEEVMDKAVAILDEMGISYEKIVSSAHRNPERTATWAKEAEGRGIKVIIAGAGLAAALPGVVAAHTPLPVIGVPIASGPLNGVDSLYSIVQMPPGIPVATVGIDNTRNAAVLAAQILALQDESIRAALLRYRDKWNQ
ncbi:MAG: 5-(carboxyamino)imidazole ribonucleotide mutase [Gemmatimonadetes bacterium]|jgi:5-(carboxyamino)imidazole ribonucleotide mutase|nr:5-(carboxyamino)imidazole ribonucleotide mutase [Gemmatimonadota bacterium]MBT5060529.1 5-(carboxyamino)imidazole ribonucleotide mutase [Gemmatimonadota bacterium]MBT5142501.1 5-(carboxyamino)imidazole ribonucleotide mutase [Gemmatimonadota bacterium]MBT5586431.1 5-(carboxyamino)imidazole ribonucleotide mutase [Gemmatimonadota bacterium]MBT5961202.1 5-(carboxyamino)imidazole ribonucleotide mutase [Gemmatimonadota bacterium]